MTPQLEAEIKLNHVIEQLATYGLTDTQGYTYAELVRKLAVARAMDVDDKPPGQSWF